MTFNTYIFILAFLPASVLGYYLLNKISVGSAKVYLIGMSLVFYGYTGLAEMKWLIISIIINYLLSIAIQCRKNNKKILWVGIILNILLLFYFKYYNFSIEIFSQITNRNYIEKNILLPLGISFFTFQQIAYLVDLYHNKIEKSGLLDYMLYVVYFPKILMGPIVKPADIIPQFQDETRKKIKFENLIIGTRMFNIGLFKKVIIADTFSKVVTWGFANLQSTTSIDLILVMLAYTFQIYFDFSGYSDMAIGISKMLNIDISINFDSPYKAYCIRDFWKRWHMSLTNFLTEYIYFPLGGSKCGQIRTYINTLIVFLISGIWHGANWTFILWGILHGLLSVLERMTDKVRKNIHPAMQWMITFGIVNILWLLFRANSVSEWIILLKKMGSLQNTSISEGLLNVFMLPEINCLRTMPLFAFLCAKIRGFFTWVFYCGALCLCLCFENTYKRTYKYTVFSAMASAVILVYSLTCMGGGICICIFQFLTWRIFII